MGYRNLYTAVNMAGEEYNISDKGLSITPGQIRVQAAPGEIAEGEFVVAGAPGTTLTGFMTSDNFHMQLRRESFAGNPDRVSWRLDARSLQEGDVVEGIIRIVSNRGEYKLPFTAEVMRREIAGRILQATEQTAGPAQAWNADPAAAQYAGPNAADAQYAGSNAAAARFLTLAEEDWGSAVKLFYKKEFEESLTTDQEKMLYRGLSRYPGNEQNVEEFLIAACGKQPVEFIIDTKEIRTEILDLGRSPSEAEASEYRIAVKRSGRGYTRLKVTMSGSFLAPAASVLDGEDFIGDASSFVYRVERHRLHAGRNFGRITLQSPYQTTELPVEIVYRRRSDGRARQEREARRTLLDMMRHYERLRVVWAAQLQGEQAGFGEGEWLRQADELVKRLSFLRRDSILPGLYAVQLLLMQNRVHQAVMELETIRRRLAEVKQGEVLEMGYVQYRGETEIEYLYRMFLTALAYHDADIITPRVGRILRERYRRSPDDWRIAWMMMQLLPEYAPGTPSRWNFIKKQFTNGCRSPLFYLEAWDMIYADPEYLSLKEDRRAGRYGGDAFERQVLVYALKKGLLDSSIMEYVLERIDRRREFSRSLYHVLSAAYAQEKMRPLQIEILRSICIMLIRGNVTSPEAFVWFSMALDKGLSITRLSECYLQSMPEDYTGVIPDVVIRMSSRGSMLLAGSRAYLYRYLYKNRHMYPDVYENCREDIRNFLEVQISEHRMSENLAALYTSALKDAAIRPSNAGDLTKLSYLSHLRTTRLEMKKAVTVYAHSSKERAYNMDKGNCILPVYGDDNVIFMEDAQQNRYTASAPYTCDRMMEPVHAPERVSLEEMADLPFILEISGVMEESFEVREETLQYCELLVRSASIAPSYRARLKLRLMDYYGKTGDLEKLRAMAGTLAPEDTESADRIRAIELMASAGMHREAAEWITVNGTENCSAELLAAVAVGADEADEAIAGRLAWAAFERGVDREDVLDLILRNYDGLTEDLMRVRGAVLENLPEDDPALAAAEDRILSQILFSGEMTGDREEILLNQYGRGEVHRDLARAGISQYCHYVFADWDSMDPAVMKLILAADREGQAMPAICRLAFLKCLADREDGFSEEESDAAQRFLTSLMREEIVFPFFRQFGGVGPGLRLYDRETMIEYHNPAGTRDARGHVVIHSAPERGGRQEPFMAREMKEMVRGFYVSSFFLFYGEQVHYFITDDPEEKNIVESGTIGQDARIDFTNADRFIQIDEMSRTLAAKDRAATADLLREYTKKEYLAQVLFGAEE